MKFIIQFNISACYMPSTNSQNILQLKRW